MRKETEEVLEHLLDMYQSGDDIETKKQCHYTRQLEIYLAFSENVVNVKFVIN